MSKKSVCSVQELATMLRNAAYADGQEHQLDWSLRVIHPSTNDGCVGYSGGIWKRQCNGGWNGYKCIDFSYSEVTGITEARAWSNHAQIQIEENPTLEELQTEIIKLFELKELYVPGARWHVVARKWIKK